MKKRLFILFISAISLCCFAQSQNVRLHSITSASGFFSKNVGSLCFTLGEPLTETFKVNSILTSGFNQPFQTIVSAEKIEIDSEINVYPNPFVSELIIRLEENQRNLIASVYSNTGQILKKLVINGPLARLQLEHLESGVYFLRISNEHYQQTYPIIKK